MTKRQTNRSARTCYLLFSRLLQQHAADYYSEIWKAHDAHDILIAAIFLDTVH